MSIPVGIVNKSLDILGFLIYRPILTIKKRGKPKKVYERERSQKDYLPTYTQKIEFKRRISININFNLSV
jgi:hypothetical protein